MLCSDLLVELEKPLDPLPEAEVRCFFLCGLSSSHPLASPFVLWLTGVPSLSHILIWCRSSLVGILFSAVSQEENITISLKPLSNSYMNARNGKAYGGGVLRAESLMG